MVLIKPINRKSALFCSSPNVLYNYLFSSAPDCDHAFSKESFEESPALSIPGKCVYSHTSLLHTILTMTEYNYTCWCCLFSFSLFSRVFWVSLLALSTGSWTLIPIASLTGKALTVYSFINFSGFPSISDVASFSRIGVFFFIATNQSFGSLGAIQLFIQQKALFM